MGFFEWLKFWKRWKQKAKMSASSQNGRTTSDKDHPSFAPSKTVSAVNTGRDAAASVVSAATEKPLTPPAFTTARETSANISQPPSATGITTTDGFKPMLGEGTAVVLSPTTDLPPEEDSDRQLAILTTKRNEIAPLDSAKNPSPYFGAPEQYTVETTIATTSSPHQTGPDNRNEEVHNGCDSSGTQTGKTDTPLTMSGTLSQIPELLSAPSAETIERNESLSAPSKQDDTAPAHDPAPNLFEGELKELQSLDVTSRLTLGTLRATGGYSDVYEGQLQVDSSHGDEKESKHVAVKCLRVFIDTNSDFAKSFVREVRLWENLKHPNILPLLGFTMVHGTLPALASEWMENGTAAEYLKKRPESDILSMAIGVANGLVYLHEKGVVHADLKAENILISATGVPLLVDFGISRLHVGANSVTIAGTKSLKGSERYLAIELMVPKDDSQARDTLEETPTTEAHEFHTKASDVWAFAMVLCRFITGEVPYSDIKNSARLPMALYENSERRPLKPSNFSTTSQAATKEQLWQVCEWCWKTDPKERPVISKVRQRLADIKAGTPNDGSLSRT